MSMAVLQVSTGHHVAAGVDYVIAELVATTVLMCLEGVNHHANAGAVFEAAQRPP